MLAMRPPGPSEAHGLFEGGGHAHRLDGHVGSEPTGEVADDGEGVLP